MTFRERAAIAIAPVFAEHAPKNARQAAVAHAAVTFANDLAKVACESWGHDRGFSDGGKCLCLRCGTTLPRAS